MLDNLRVFDFILLQSLAVGLVTSFIFTNGTLPLKAMRENEKFATLTRAVMLSAISVMMIFFSILFHDIAGHWSRWAAPSFEMMSTLVMIPLVIAMHQFLTILHKEEKPQDLTQYTKCGSRNFLYRVLYYGLIVVTYTLAFYPLITLYAAGWLLILVAPDASHSFRAVKKDKTADKGGTDVESVPIPSMQTGIEVVTEEEIDYKIVPSKELDIWSWLAFGCIILSVVMLLASLPLLLRMCQAGKWRHMAEVRRCF